MHTRNEARYAIQAGESTKQSILLDTVGSLAGAAAVASLGSGAGSGKTLAGKTAAKSVKLGK
jgi:hypothetical protein